MERRKKLRLIQINLLLVGLLIIFFTYFKKENNIKDEIISKDIQKKIVAQNLDQQNNLNVFYNIEYSGFDLSGNRYVLKSKKAYNDSAVKENVIMENVESIFYFKDNTVLYIWSNEGIYNNLTLDMNFMGNVKGLYENSELFAEKAEYSNSKSMLTISENVEINDSRVTMVADKLLFDIKKQTLNITSFNNGKINANVNLQ
jgi:hypothetical protein